MNAAHLGRPARILLVTSTNNAYTRGLTAGVAEFAQMHHWQVTPLLVYPGLTVPWMACDGVITVTAIYIQELIDAPIPAVICSSAQPVIALPSVTTDNHAIGRLAAEHLIERRLRHFACYGPEGILMAQQRLDSFSAAIAEVGGSCSRLEEPGNYWAVRPWDTWSPAVGKWLTSLPKPVGVFTVTDELAQGLLGVCHDCGLRVPDDVAMVGVNNDEVLAGLAQPPLTSVIPNAPRIGRLAAETLGGLMRGRNPVQTIRLVPPLGVESRQSTNLLAVEDRDAVRAYRFIHDQAHQPLGVNDVAEGVAMSRRALERHFKAAFGRTVLTEIRLAHISRAKQLLATTDLSLAEIAPLAGFRHTENFHAAFRRVTGTTPAHYRARLFSTEHHRSVEST